MFRGKQELTRVDEHHPWPAPDDESWRWKDRAGHEYIVYEYNGHLIRVFQNHILEAEAIMAQGN